MTVAVRLSLVVVLMLVGVAGGCGRATPGAQTPATRTGAPVAASPGVNPAPDDTGDWVRPAKDFASTRYSGLDALTPESVKGLVVTNTFSTGFVRGHEAAPLVIHNTMYVVTPFPNILYALDLTQSGAPAKWTFKPSPALASQGVACCDLVNRGINYADGKILRISIYQ